MKRSGPRTVLPLDHSTKRRLDMYAMAAGAAGVGVLALAQPAEAKIIYHKTYQILGEGGVYHLDLNGTGTTEFTIDNVSRTRTSARIHSLTAVGAPGNSVVIGSHSSAAALVKGASIPGANRFARSGLMAFQCTGFTSCGTGATITLGPWANVSNRYLGLKFQISGTTHYGWARLTVKVSKSQFEVTATLTGYAYQTVANKSIVAGKTNGPDATALQPTTLGLLALGRK